MPWEAKIDGKNTAVVLEIKPQRGIIEMADISGKVLQNYRTPKAKEYKAEVGGDELRARMNAARGLAGKEKAGCQTKGNSRW